MTSTADLLELRVPSRADLFIWELLDAHRNVLGPLKVSSTATPRVSNNTSRSVFRTCTGLTLVDGAPFGSDYVRLADIDTLKHRVRPTMVLQNGDRFPLGVFMIGDDVRAPYSWGTLWTPALFDETFMVDQPLDQTYGLAPGDSILSLVNELVAQVGLVDVDLSGVTDGFASTAATYQAGSSRNAAVVALLAMLGCYPPYFNNAGTYTAKAAPSSTPGPDHVYGSGARILDGATTVTNSIYRAPNRYQVIGTSPSGAFVGIYDLPDSAPNSFAHTGVRVLKSTTMQGVPSVGVANLAAYISALTDRDSYIQAAFSSTADPRHDTFDVVELLGNLYQEVGWEIECRSGGPMTHQLVGLFGAEIIDTVIDAGSTGGAEGGGSTGGSGGGTGGGDLAPAFVAQNPPDTVNGNSYSYAFTTTASPPVTAYAVPGATLSGGSYSGGPLPPGLSLNATTGVLSGTVAAVGTYSFTVTATNGVAPDASTSTIIVVSATGGGGSGIPSLLSVNDPGTTDSITWAAFLATTGVVKGRPFTSGGQDSEPATGNELQGYKNAHSFAVAAGDFGIVPTGGALALIATRDAMTSQPDGAARAYSSGYVQTGGDSPDSTAVAFQFGPNEVASPSGVRMEFDYYCGMFTGNAFSTPGSCVFPSSSRGAGLWPAIWLLERLGATFGWPPEIDIMEQFGRIDRNEGHMHVGAAFNDGITIDNNGYPSFPHVTLDSTAGITVAIEWTATHVQFFAGPIGGTLVSLGSYTGAHVPQNAMYLNFNLAIGNAAIGGPPNLADFPTPGTLGGAALLISRVRVTAL